MTADSNIVYQASRRRKKRNPLDKVRYKSEAGTDLVMGDFDHLVTEMKSMLDTDLVKDTKPA